MADIALKFRQAAATAPVIADWTVEAGDLGRDRTLETAVYLSLYTDADAPDDVEVPEGLSPHIWWGQAYWDRVFAAIGIEVRGLPLGSLRWTLVREKQTEETRARSVAYDRRALAWMAAAGLAKSVDVAAEWGDPGVLETTITITKPDGLVERYQAFWQVAS